MSKWEQLEDTIKGLTDERLIEVAKEIYDYTETSKNVEDSFVNEMSELLHIQNRDIEHYVLDELSRRYKTLVLLLLKNRIGDFIVKA